MVFKAVLFVNNIVSMSPKIEVQRFIDQNIVQAVLPLCKSQHKKLHQQAIYILRNLGVHPNGPDDDAMSGFKDNVLTEEVVHAVVEVGIFTSKSF